MDNSIYTQPIVDEVYDRLADLSERVVDVDIKEKRLKPNRVYLIRKLKKSVFGLSKKFLKEIDITDVVVYEYKYKGQILDYVVMFFNSKLETVFKFHIHESTYVL